MGGELEGRGSNLLHSPSLSLSFSPRFPSLFSLLFFFLFVTGWRFCVYACVFYFSQTLTLRFASLSLLIGHAIKGSLFPKLLTRKPSRLDDLGKVGVLWVNVHRPQHGLRR